MDLEDGGKVRGFHRRGKEAPASAVTSRSILEERFVRDSSCSMHDYVKNKLSNRHITSLS